jgi:hypothetical protein
MVRDAYHVELTRCEIHENTGRGVTVLGDTNQLVVQGGSVYANSEYGVSVIGDASKTCTGLNLSCVDIRDNGTSAPGTYSGVYLGNITVNPVVQGCTISGHTYYGVESTINVSNLRLLNNDLGGNTVGATFLATDAGRRITRNNLSYPDDFRATTSYAPPSLADGEGASKTMTVAGVSVGDFANASFSEPLVGVLLAASVSAADTVVVRFQNETGATVSLASGTLRCRVVKRDQE